MVFNGSGNFSATRTDTLTDTAQVVDARTTTGNLLLNFSALNAASSANGSALFANVTTSGTIDVTTGVVTVTGTAQTNGLYLSGTNGNIALVAGTTKANMNDSDRAINVTTPVGDITITSTEADGGLRGISTSDGTGRALPSGTTTITSGIATANGAGQINAIVAQGKTVNLTSDTASNTSAAGNQGTAIFVQAGAGGATVKSTTANVAGLNQAGISVGAEDNGNVSIDSGTVNATQSATGIVTDTTGGSGATTIKSGAINLGGANSYGLQVNNGTGLTTIDSGTITANGINTTGIVGNTAGNATIKSGTITLNAAGGTGIDWTATDAATTSIDSTAIVGGGIIVTAGSGATSLKSGAITGGVIDIEYGTGAVAITSGSMTQTSGTAITAANYGGAATDGVSVTSGSIAGAGSGISVNSAGPVLVDSGSIALSSVASRNVNSLSGLGISVVASGSGDTTIKSGSLIYTGAGNTFGISAQAVGGGALNITSGTVSVIGNGGYGILGYTTSGAVNIVSTGDVTTQGTTRAAGGSTLPANQRFADGIDALSYTGAITVASAGTVSTAGATARGIDVEAGRAITTFGFTTDASSAQISVTNSGTVKTTGAGANAINVAADNNAVTLTSANVSTTGAGSIGINVSGGSGAIVVNTGNVSTTGANADAVHLVSASGPVTANVTGTVSAANGTAVFIDPPSAVTVNVAAGASATGSTNGLSVVGSTNSIVNLGTVATTGAGAAILASGTTTLDNSGTISAGSGGIAVQLGATNDTVALRTGSSISGAVAGGGGTDAVILAGTVGMKTGAQSIASFTGFDSLTVASGYWTAGATPSTFNSATVASGGSLELSNAGAGLGISVPSITNNGTLVVRSTAAASGSTFGAVTVTGTGGVLLTGSGTVTLDGNNSLANTGAITVDNGTTAVVTGTQGGNVVTAVGGTLQIGNGGTAGTFTGSLADNGTLVVARSDDYTFSGALTGEGAIVKNGAGKLTFGTGYAFTGTTTINGGSVKLSTPVAASTQLDVEGAGQLDLSGTRQTVAELAGTSTAASVNIAGGSLAVNQATNTVFAGNITGAGSFTKTGSGSLNFTGNSTYTGATTIDGGRLAVNGSIVSAVTVNPGGVLGGTGSIGGAAIAAGGTYAPGNSIGTQTVNGNVSFAAGSTYEVQANADGRSDKIVATGTATIAGGTVSVLAEAGTFAKVTGYSILTAAGGVTGKFTNVTSNFAFLSPILDYTATSVNLTLARNDLSFGSIATNPNQLAVANAVATRGLSDPVYNAVLLQSTAGGQAAFTELSGELFASVPTVLIDEGRRLREAVLERASVAGDGFGVWATSLRSLAQSGSGNGIAKTNTDRWGVVSGIDYGRNGFRVGAAGGYVDSNIDMGARASHAGVTTKLVAVYGGWTGGRLAVEAGGSYSWHDVDTTRTIATVGLAGSERSSYKANSEQLFADASYKLVDGPLSAAPFVSYAHFRTHSNQAVESGTAAALTVAANTRDADFATFGLRLAGQAAMSSRAIFLPRMSVSYQLGRGDLSGTTSATFGGTGTPFGVTGARLGRDTFNVDGGFDVVMGRFRIGAGAFASTATAFSDQGGKVTLGLSF